MRRYLALNDVLNRCTPPCLSHFTGQLHGHQPSLDGMSDEASESGVGVKESDGVYRTLSVSADLCVPVCAFVCFVCVFVCLGK